jgi:hypothetical protein
MDPDDWHRYDLKQDDCSNNFTGPLYHSSGSDTDRGPAPARRRKKLRRRLAMAAGGASPSSSPRLPSPPPFTEVQIGPKSPTVTDSFGNVNEKIPGDASGEAAEGSLRRIRPGTSAADMAAGPPLVPLSQVSSSVKSMHLAYANRTSSWTHHFSCKNTSKRYIRITLAQTNRAHSFRSHERLPWTWQSLPRAWSGRSGSTSSAVFSP